MITTARQLKDLIRNLKEKLALERKEKAEYAKKVGQLTMQVDWLKKI